MTITSYLAKWFGSASDYLPQTVTQLGERLWKDPIPFAVSDMYDYSSSENIAISYSWLPFSSSPAMIVVSGNKSNMQAVTSYGGDDTARMPLNFIKEMAGTENIINMNDAHSVIQRKKIKPFLTERKSITEAYTSSQAQFNDLFEHWDKNISLQDNVSYGCINIIARCVLGIPELTREQAHVITHAGHLLRESQPKAPDFAKGQEEVAVLNDELMLLHKNVLLTHDNYIQKKADINSSDSDNEKLQKLLATRGVSNLLVESNLTALIMTGIVYVNQLKDIKQQLLEEINNVSELSLDTMRSLPYLDRVYKEALRFSSPTPMIIRETSKAIDLTITDDNNNQKIYRTPSHALLFAPIRRMHHDLRYWEKPEKFQPDRFKDPAALKHFMPFSLGTRSCPAASNFNEVVFKTAILASLKYQFELDKEMEDIPADSLTSRWKQEYYFTKIEPIRLDAPKLTI